MRSDPVDAAVVVANKVDDVAAIDESTVAALVVVDATDVFATDVVVAPTGGGTDTTGGADVAGGTDEGSDTETVDCDVKRARSPGTVNQASTDMMVPSARTAMPTRTGPAPLDRFADPPVAGAEAPGPREAAGGGGNAIGFTTGAATVAGAAAPVGVAGGGLVFGSAAPAGVGVIGRRLSVV